MTKTPTTSQPEDSPFVETERAIRSIAGERGSFAMDMVGRALIEFARARGRNDQEASQIIFQELQTLIGGPDGDDWTPSKHQALASFIRKNRARLAAAMASTIEDAAVAAHHTIQDFAADRRTSGPRIAAARKSLEKESDRKNTLAPLALAHGSTELLEAALRTRLAEFGERVGRCPDNCPKGMPESLPLTDGILHLDALFAKYLEGMGSAGIKQADAIRKTAAERLAQFEADGAIAPVWHLWLMLEDNAIFPPYVETLARVLWRDDVGLQIKRERAKAATPVRMPTDMSRTFAMARSIGGAIVGTSIMVEPPKGLALMLPFDDDLKVSRRLGGGDMVNLRQVLSPNALRTYLATLVLFQDAGSRDDGSFELEGPGAILDVTGATRHEEKKRGRVYLRYATKDTKSVADHLESFTRMRVRVVGELEAIAGDALIDEIKDRRNGRIVTYAHARLIAAKLKHDYVRIPRAVCKLAPGDVPIGMGIATVVRTKVLALLKKGTAIEAPIEAWLEACGLDATEGARKHGRSYWTSIAADLSRVADDGRLGRMKAAGSGRNAVLTLDLHSDLHDSYSPLLEASKGHERAKRAAMVADHRRRPRAK